MIRYLQSNEIDRARWDHCLDRAVNSRIYGYSWYLDCVSPGWEALVQADYEAVMPLPARRKYFLFTLQQPFFTQQLGVFSSNQAVLKLGKEFLDAIPAKFRFIDLQLNEENSVEENDFEVMQRENHLLSLKADYAALRKGYNSQAKRNLKKADWAFLLEKNLDTETVVEFYRRHKSEETKGVKAADYQRLKVLLKSAAARNKVVCTGVEDSEGNLQAAAAFLLHHDRIIFLIGNGTQAGRDVGAMSFLMDKIIQQHAGQSLWLDFEGSMIPGIARFFKSFGASVRTYPRIRKNTLPGILRIFKK